MKAVEIDFKTSTQAINLKKKKKKHQNHVRNDAPSPVSGSHAIGSHLVCALGLALSFWATHNFFSTNLISDPVHTLLLTWVFETPIVVLVYSRFRKNPKECSYWRAVGRGLLGIPLGALINIFGAIALGAPVGIQYLLRTINWSLLMSLLTFVPAACVFGSSWTDWQRVFAHTKPIGAIDYMICLPAHGAIIGAWLGAWPMPLDWERPWQEWPVCVSYGAMAGYLVAMVASLGFTLVRVARLPLKQD